jgi:hypothetical protein
MTSEPHSGPTGDPIADAILARREVRRREALRQFSRDWTRCLPEDLRAIVALALEEIDGAQEIPADPPTQRRAVR